VESLLRYLSEPSTCGYLPDQIWRLEFEHVAALTPHEYMERMAQGWRRFGYTLFRPRCRSCSACQPLRVLVDGFRPDRSQRRAWKSNVGEIMLRIQEPAVTREKLALYDRYHSFQTEAKGWPAHAPKDPEDYARSFVHNPFPTEEWCYFLGRKLIGVGYVDSLSLGMSGIYFFYDPRASQRSLGTFNVVSLLREAARRRSPHLYLGFYVAGCRSMMYKSRFLPNQVLAPDGNWCDFKN
jgi:arginine-tRNA-protein transferase